MNISDRVKSFESVGIIKFIGLSKKLKNPIDLSIGIPYFKTPDTIKNAAIKAIEDDKTTYVEAAGLPELRDVVANKLNNKNSIKAKAEDVVITAGVSGGLLLAYSVIMNPGDEIIIPDPFFLAYRELATFLGIKARYLSTYPDFDINLDRLEKLITPKTKAIIINNPNNPTGKVYSKDKLIQLADFARQHDLYIISDEVYEDFDYDKKFVAFGSLYEKTITLNGISKSYAATGLRIGYIHSPKELVKPIIETQQFTLFSSSSIAQYAAIAAFDVDVSKEIESHNRKRKFLLSNLSSKYKIEGGEGGYFLFLEHPSLTGTEVFEKCLKQNLLLVQGGIFSNEDSHFRISYSVPDDTLKKGVEILNSII